jgi:hypothetical protein
MVVSSPQFKPTLAMIPWDSDSVRNSIELFSPQWPPGCHGREADKPLSRPGSALYPDRRQQTIEGDRLRHMPLILILVILLLLFGGGGYYMGPGLGYYGGGGLSLVLLIVILFLLFGRGRTRL